MCVAFFIRNGLMIRTARLSGQGEIPASAGMQSAPREAVQARSCRIAAAKQKTLNFKDCKAELLSIA